MNRPRVLIELRPSRVHRGGVGVFAVRDIDRGQKVAEGIAEQDFETLVPWEFVKHCDPDFAERILNFCIGTPEGFIPPPGFDFNKLSIEWYLNHSCEGNCCFDDDGDFVAIRRIAKGNELTYDYGLVESNPDFRMPCTCGSRNCRHVITGNDWKDEAFQALHRDRMHPHLRHLIPVRA
jgi:hypothetical protein